MSHIGMGGAIRRLLVSGLTASVVAGVSVLAAGPVSAAGIVVDSLADSVAIDGQCTLREAITNANNNDQSGSTDCAAGAGADTIGFSVTGTITVTSVLVPRDDLTIAGPGATELTISGNSSTQVFASFSSLTLSGLTITGGNAQGAGAGGQGGALHMFCSAALTLTGVTISGNRADIGGGISAGCLNPTTISNSTISDNHAEGNAGGINAGGTVGLTITNTTIAGNSAGTLAGGLYTYGSTTITNSTIAGNTAALTGGGIYNVFSAGPITATGTILAANSPENCINTTDGGHNISSDASCATDATSQANTDPNLGALSDNGGPTQTMLPGAGSAAINGGGPGPCPTTADQRGVSRPQGSACDVGAVEVEAPPDTTPPAVTPNVVGTLGSNGWYTSDVTVTWTVSDPESTISNQTGCGSTTIAADTAATTLTCSATSDGGTAAPSVTIKRDATAPTLAPAGLTAGRVFAVGAPVPTLTAGAADATSKVATQSCGPVNTATVGAFSVTCTATDNAGNTATFAPPLTYSVTDAFLGFTSPLPKSTQKAGSTIPVKFALGVYSGGSPRVTDAAGRLRVTVNGNTGTCAYSAATGAYQCQLKMPTKKGGYTIDAWENLGTSTVANWQLIANASPVTGKTNANQEPITIK